MFEQERMENGQRGGGLFRSPDRPAAGMSRFRISSPNDPAELEAERMAQSVTGDGGIFRSPEGAADGGGEADLSTLDLAGVGSPLPMGLQSSMEESFGANFSGVRIHTGAGADRASRQISARAFTRGRDVYFRSGTYNPDSREGQHLIAHELAHVAAGDGGIHRAGDEQPEQTPQRTPPDAALKNFVQTTELNILGLEMNLQKYRSPDDVKNALAGGTVKRLEMEARLESARSDRQKAQDWSGEISERMSEYLAAAREGGSEESAKENQIYMHAQEVLDQLSELESKLETQASHMEEGLRAFQAEENLGEDVEFSAPVDRMLASGFCGQFFKAVGDIQKGKNGNFEALNQTAVDQAANLHGDVAESSAEKTARMAGNVSTVSGIAGVGTDLLSGASDLNSEKDTLNEHDQNFRAASGALSAGTGAVGTAADAVSMGMEADSLRAQAAARKNKLQAMAQRNQQNNVADTGIGSAGTVDRADLMGIAGQGAGVLSGAAGVGSSIAGGFKKENETAGNWNNALGLTSSVLGTAADTLGVAADSDKAEQARQKDKAAKESMRALGRQLEGTLPARRSGRSALIALVCERVRGSKFNAVRGEGNGMGDLIQAAIDGEREGIRDPRAMEELKKPELTSKQKSLLTSMQLLETNRATSKNEAAAARKDAYFSALGLGGSIMGLIGNSLKQANFGVAGTIIGMLGSLVGLIGKGREAMQMHQETEESRQQDRNDERNAKVAACTSAVNQMADLPPLSLAVLQTAKRERRMLPSSVMDAAEQYAAVFSMIEAANVEMTDLLYAIEMGEFGKENLPDDDEQTREDRLKASLGKMYTHLSFT